ncbi:ROK family protein [Streptomyces sp. NPDC058534]|uniref:ROK family protein n=1 Tax=Streptomyces sp. NPDC058534 TaxID=3346541 RepID=UPI00365D5F90
MSTPHPGTPAERRPVIALDLGGTKIAAALVAADGTLSGRSTRPTPGSAGPTAVLDALTDAVADTIAAAGRSTDAVRAVGVASPGVVDPVSGTVRAATTQLRDWTGTRLGPELAARTGLPVACDNDVRAAAGAEPASLASPSASFLLLFVGTGVGGAVAVEGRMLHGHTGIAGHLGHLPVPEADGLLCTCGAIGHLEAVAAGPGITALYERRSGRGADRLETVVRRAESGDAFAAEAIETGARAAGRVLGGLANAFGPDAVVVGGGVAGIGERYWVPLRAAFAAERMAPLSGLVPRPPRAGSDTALLGAAALADIAPLHRPPAAATPLPIPVAAAAPAEEHAS